MKKRISFLLAVLLLLSAANLPGFASFARAQEAPCFSAAYAKPGRPLSVDYEPAGEAEYRWAVNGEARSANGNTYTPSQEDLEKFITAEVIENGSTVAVLSTFCSLLPVLYIDTENSAAIESKDEYIGCTLKVQGNDTFNGENCDLYSGAAQIKGRGNSTWRWFSKKPYKLKLDKKADLFGMGKSKHWVLLANYIDETLMRNAASVELAKITGAQHLDCTWVDVVMNGECIGNYQLYEHARIESNRIDIYNWEDTAESIAKAVKKKNDLTSEDQDAIEDMLVSDMRWMTSGKFTYGGTEYTVADYAELPAKVDGGVLFEIDFNMDEISTFYTNASTPVMIKSPEYLCTNPDAMAQIRQELQNFENAIYSADRNVVLNGERVPYTALCDFDSLISYFLTCELLECEIGSKSTFFYKDIGEKIVFGPVWDFDYSSNNVAPWHVTSPVQWKTAGVPWFSVVNEDPYFAVKLRELYLDTFDQIKAFAAEGGTLDAWYAYLKASALKNEELWHYSRGFEEDFKALKQWFTDRLAWMNGQLSSDRAALASFGGGESSRLQLSAVNAAENCEGYILPQSAGSLTLNVTADAGISRANCYVNNVYFGELSFTDGAAQIDIPLNAFTEEPGKKNVVTVRAAEDLSVMRFAAVTVYENAVPAQVSVAFTDVDDTQTVNASAGAKVFLKAPAQPKETTVFLGWTDGAQTYPAGDWYTAETNAALAAVYAQCADGGIVHQLSLSGDDCLCSVCGASKPDYNDYVPVAHCSFTQSSRYNNRYTGDTVRPAIGVYYAGRQLTEGKEYTISFKNDVNVGFGTYTIKGVKAEGFSGETALSYRIIPALLSKVKVGVKEFTYTGSEIDPDFGLTYKGHALVKGVDYDIVEITGNVEIGYGAAKLAGKGNFSGEREITFLIKKPVPPATDLKAAIERDGQVTLRWTPSSDCGGYYISRRLGTDNPYEVIADLTDPTAASFVDETVVSGSKYYYAVRPYARINGLELKSNKAATVSITAYKYMQPVQAYFATANAYNTITVYWSVAAANAQYEVWRSTSENGNYKLIATVAGTSYKDKTVNVADSYFYKVVPFVKNGAVKGEASNVVSAKPSLETVSGLKAASSAYNKIELTWEKAPGATGYAVYRYNKTKGAYEKIGATASASYTDSKITVNTKYTYRVKAYRTVAGKDYYSVYSEKASAKAVLKKATGVKAASASYNSVKLSWNKVAGATGYVVYRYNAKTAKYVKLASVKTNAYTHKDLTTNKKYYYKVRAYRTVNGKNYYNAYSTSVAAAPKLGTVSGLSAAAKSATEVKLSWAKVPGAAGYVVYRSASKNGTFKKVGTASANSYANAKLNPGTAYYYKVRAYIKLASGTQYGAYSKAVSGKTLLK